MIEYHRPFKLISRRKGQLHVYAWCRISLNTAAGSDRTIGGDTRYCSCHCFRSARDYGVELDSAQEITSARGDSYCSHALRALRYAPAHQLFRTLAGWQGRGDYS